MMAMGTQIRITRDDKWEWRKHLSHCAALRDATALEEDLNDDSGDVFRATHGYPIFISARGDAYCFSIPRSCSTHELGRSAIFADKDVRRAAEGGI